MKLTENLPDSRACVIASGNFFETFAMMSEGFSKVSEIASGPVKAGPFFRVLTSSGVTSLASVSMGVASKADTNPQHIKPAAAIRSLTRAKILALVN